MVHAEHMGYLDGTLYISITSHLNKRNNVIVFSHEGQQLLVLKTTNIYRIEDR